MTKPLLIWQPNVFPDEEKEIARKYFDVHIFNVWDNIQKDVPFAMRGAVAFAPRLRHNLSRFNKSFWTPWLSQYMISKNFWWKTAATVGDQYFHKQFIAPDSCKKLFAGQLFTYAKWQEEFSYLKQKNGEKILCFCAEQEWIGREWRCLFVGQELVGISDYMYELEILDEPGQRNITEELKTFAKTIRANSYFSPEDNLTIDIGQRSDGSYGLVEINFLETAGWYAVDKDKVYAKLAEQLA